MTMKLEKRVTILYCEERRCLFNIYLSTFRILSDRFVHKHMHSAHGVHGVHAIHIAYFMQYIYF